MWRLLALAFLFPALVAAQEEHNHPAPEKLGTASFSTSCKPTTQQEFNRAIALLHSFAYKPAEEAFQSVAERDPRCAIAHWGIAMTHYHQLPDESLTQMKSFQNSSFQYSRNSGHSQRPSRVPELFILRGKTARDQGRKMGFYQGF